MTRSVLIIGKRGGILRWFEHVLDAQDQLPDIALYGFALNHNNQRERLTKRLLLSTGGDPAFDKYTAKRLDQCITRTRPDIIIVTDRFYLREAYRQSLQRARQQAVIAHWIGDRFDERLAHHADVIDHFFFTTTSLVEAGRTLSLPGCTLVPLAYNPKMYFPGNLVPEQRDQRPLFIGAYSPNREALFTSLRVPLVIFGKGWKPHALPQHECHDRNIPAKKVAELYRRHLPVLNLINSDNISSGLNMRCFEAPGSGALLVTDANSDLALCYAEDEVLSYHSTDACQSVLESLHPLPSRVIDIAIKGHQRCAESHHYASRVQTIVNTLIEQRTAASS